MKFKLTSLLLLAVISFSSLTVNATSTVSISENSSIGKNWAQVFNTAPEIKDLPEDVFKMHLDLFMSLTPAKYKELTGKNLGFKKSMELKAAQKYLKKQLNAGADVSKGLYVVLAIIGLGWVAMGILDDWSGSDWIISLVLSLLCWLPGVIYSLVKMKKYYS